MPQLDPWDASILKYYKEAPALTCTPIQPNVTYVENGYLKVLLKKWYKVLDNL